MSFPPKSSNYFVSLFTVIGSLKNKTCLNIFWLIHFFFQIFFSFLVVLFLCFMFLIVMASFKTNSVFCKNSETLTHFLKLHNSSFNRLHFVLKLRILVLFEYAITSRHKICSLSKLQNKEELYGSFNGKLTFFFSLELFIFLLFFKSNFFLILQSFSVLL